MCWPRRVTALCAAALAAAACDDARSATSPGGDRTPSAKSSGAARDVAPLPTFVDVAKEAGVAVVNHTGMKDQKDWIVSGSAAGRSRSTTTKTVAWTSSSSTARC